MSRLTEYHGDVPVIKDKRFGEAAAKLALYEDIEEQKKKENGILITAGNDGLFSELEPFATIVCKTKEDYATLRKAIDSLKGV